MRLQTLLITLFLTIYSSNLFSTNSVNVDSSNTEAVQHGGAYDPVETIMHHVQDAHEFPIIGDLALPLPIIIYNKTKGTFFTALSSAFHPHHGTSDKIIDGYKYEHEHIASVDNDSLIDLSITKNVFGMFLGMIVVFVIMFSIRKHYKEGNNNAPKGLQGFIEPLIQFVAHDIAKQNIGKNYLKFVPYLMSVFFFILINNLLGLIPIFPGSANVTGNIGFTLVLAFLSFLMINIFAKKDYWGHIFAMPGVPKPVLFLLTPLEIIGIFIKPIALMLRLFGNIIGGHITILSIASLVFILGQVGKSFSGALAGGIIAVPLLIFVNAMELFVAFLQAYVFTLLTSIFIGIAQEEHHHEGHH
jgi:F-type H+-transporting ATPase subunit a